MTDRSPVDGLMRRQRRDIRLLYRTLGDAVRNAVTSAGAPDRVITEADRAAIMREVDRGLDAIWGNAPGSDSAMRRIVVRDTQAARFRSLERAVGDWRRALPRALRARIEEEAHR